MLQPPKLRSQGEHGNEEKSRSQLGWAMLILQLNGTGCEPPNPPITNGEANPQLL